MRIGLLTRRACPRVDPFAGVPGVEPRLLEDGFLVVADGDAFLGVLEPEDVLRAPRALVVDCLRAKPHVDETTPVADVLAVMLDAGATALPVFAGDRFVGVCVRADIAAALESSRGALAGELARTVADLEDETASRARAEAQRHLLEAAVDQTHDAVVITDANGRVVYANAAGERLLGRPRDALQGAPLDALAAPDLDGQPARPLWEAVAAGRAWTGRRAATGPGGRRVEHEVSVSPVVGDDGVTRHLVAVLRDVTEQVQAERKLRQAEKMQALGTLASGVAHDFNNLLTAIVGYAEMAALEATPAVRDLTAQILVAADRAADLTGRILTFGRASEAGYRPVAARAVVEEALLLLEGSLLSRVRVERDLGAQGVVLADASQLHQVVLNLAANAGYAMRDAGGTLTVALDDVDAADAGPTAEGLPAGPYVRLRVRDTGPGMPAEVAARAFEPFFTTKPPSEGTGMGLAVVHGVVRRHGGAVHVDSAPGQGTTVTVLLPRHDKGPSAVPPAATAAPGGREGVLVLDRDPQVAEVERALLASLGYAARAFSELAPALELLRQAPDAWPLALVATSLAGVGGQELVRALADARPGLRVVVATGHGPRAEDPASLGAPVVAVLGKPLRRDALARAVRAALDAPGP